MNIMKVVVLCNGYVCIRFFIIGSGQDCIAAGYMYNIFSMDRSILATPYFPKSESGPHTQKHLPTPVLGSPNSPILIQNVSRELVLHAEVTTNSPQKHLLDVLFTHEELSTGNCMKPTRAGKKFRFNETTGN